MITFPNAKINIGLNVVEKRPDGFHNIETVFYPIGLTDILEINLSENDYNFKNTGLKVENGTYENNICYKAYQLIKCKFSIPSVEMHLHKIIPFGAGLGGGSADGSFTLNVLNQLFNLNLTTNQLLSFAEQLGSDCPFFIFKKPAFATEKGNRLQSIKVNLNNYHLVLVHPGIHVNTGQAYSSIKPRKPDKSLLDLIQQPVELWKDSIINDFEESVFKIYPEIGKIKDKLYQSGAIYASMSGSGSSVYGIFRNDIETKPVFKNYFVWKEKL